MSCASRLFARVVTLEYIEKGDESVLDKSSR